MFAQPTGRERMGSPTLQTLHDPIVLTWGARAPASRTEPQIREYFASGGTSVPSTSAPAASPVGVPTLTPDGGLLWEALADFPQLEAVRSHAPP
jgi:hypothetical protein